MEKALQPEASEAEANLTLRSDGQIDDEIYDRERLEIVDRQLTSPIKQPERQLTDKELLYRLQQILILSLTAP